MQAAAGCKSIDYFSTKSCTMYAETCTLTGTNGNVVAKPAEVKSFNFNRALVNAHQNSLGAQKKTINLLKHSGIAKWMHDCMRHCELMRPACKSIDYFDSKWCNMYSGMHSRQRWHKRETRRKASLGQIFQLQPYEI